MARVFVFFFLVLVCLAVQFGLLVQHHLVARVHLGRVSQLRRSGDGRHADLAPGRIVLAQLVVTVHGFRRGRVDSDGTASGALAGAPARPHHGRAAAVNLFEAGAFQFQQFPHVRLADENEKDEDAREDVEDVGEEPIVGVAAHGVADYFRHPTDAHEDKEAENDSEPEPKIN